MATKYVKDGIATAPPKYNKLHSAPVACLIYVGLWGLFGQVTPSKAVALDQAKTHVLFIVADDLRADMMSVYGGPVLTPNLEQLAARGCVFERATCGYPICHVSRTEILTGRFLVAEAAQGKQIPFQPAWQLWPRIMRDAGWHTVYVGKWHCEGNPWNRGYEQTVHLFSSGGASGMELTFPHSATNREVSGYIGWTFKTDENKPQLDKGIGLTPDTDSIIADGAIMAFENNPGTPLFVHVNFTAPHDPLHWPRGYSRRLSSIDEKRLPANFRPQHAFDHGNAGGRDESIVPSPRTEQEVLKECEIYDALIANIDRQIGRIAEALKQKGDWEQTLIIFTSDHGLALGSHGLMGKQNQYEHTANVPLILAGPGIPAGRRLQAQCGLRDLFPTVCDLNRLTIPPSVQGQSLVPVLQGPHTEVHTEIFGYFTDKQRMLRTADGWKLIWYPQIKRTQLFDISNDQQELRDLSGKPDYAARHQHMFQRLQSWLQEQGDESPFLR